MNKNLYKIVLQITFVFIFIGNFCLIKAQEIPLNANERVVTRSKFFEFTPVQFGKLRFDGNTVGFKKSFITKNPDWINDISFVVRNLTLKKKIIYLQILVCVPPTKEGEVELAFPMSFGTTSVLTKDGKEIVLMKNNLPLSFLPGDDINVNLSSNYKQFARFIEERKSISSINIIKLRPGKVIFDDGVEWEPNDHYLKRDSSNPGKMIETAVPELAAYRGSF